MPSASARLRVVCAPRVFRIISRRSAVRSATISCVTGYFPRVMEPILEAFGFKSRHRGIKKAQSFKIMREHLMKAALPETLERLVVAHGRSHAPHYPPDDNSDHGPMAYLA